MKTNQIVLLKHPNMPGYVSRTPCNPAVHADLSHVLAIGIQHVRQSFDLCAECQIIYEIKTFRI